MQKIDKKYLLQLGLWQKDQGSWGEDGCRDRERDRPLTTACKQEEGVKTKPNKQLRLIYYCPGSFTGSVFPTHSFSKITVQLDQKPNCGTGFAFQDTSSIREGRFHPSVILFSSILFSLYTEWDGICDPQEANVNTHTHTNKQTHQQ